MQHVRMDQFASSGTTAYWLSRSAALSALQQVEAGHPPAATQSMVLPNGTVTTQCTAQTSGSTMSWTIRAAGYSGGCVNTVSLTYSATEHRVVQWQDNVAGS
jgi:hypothetical protein